MGKFDHLEHTRKPDRNLSEITEFELEKFHEMKNLKDAMGWGSAEHGIPQLTHNEVILINMIEKLLNKQE